MRLGRYRQSPADRKRYEVVYSDWLNEDELVSDVEISVPVNHDGFYVDGYMANNDGKSVAFYVSGGVEGGEYDVTVRIETTMQQVKEDWVTFVVTGG